MVKDLNGQPVPVRTTEEGTWVVSKRGGAAEVVLSYDLVLDHEETTWPGGIDGVAYRRNWGIMATGRSLFVMNGKDKKDIRVHIEAPESWNISASWPLDGVGNNYRVGSLPVLQESFIVAGNHKEITVDREGFTLRFVLGGEKVKGEASRYSEVATELMDYYIDLMGGTPKPAPGLELKQCLVLISQSDQVDGEVIGNHLSMFINPGGNPMEQMVGWFMFAHEFYHLWNGKTLRFTNTSTDWFKEGISNYYTIKALKQTGFIEEESLLAILNNLFYQRYIQDPGYGVLAPADAASGFEKDKHWGLVYGGGLFAGIVMDMEIRQRTANTRSLDDLMRSFYKGYGGTNRRIRQEDILTGVNQLGSTDFSGFFKEHIQGPEPITLGPSMKFAGVRVQTQGGQLEFSHTREKTPLQKAIWEGFLGGDKE